MLDPNTREVYTDQLMPPEGYRLNLAVATTYSLDLMSLLMAPISMTLQDCRNQRSVMNDPVALVEALHRSANRFLVFCQRGRIYIPSQDTLLYSYLEKVVVEVQPSNSDGVFHPKTWLLRYVGEEKDHPIVYRFLCLSRNLTFDRSWDTVLVLEGTLDDRRLRGIGLCRPLGQFFRYLPELATRKLSAKWVDTVRKMADEVTRVRFKPPEDFGGIKNFIPVGIPGNRRFSWPKEFKKALIVSPFISPETLKRLTGIGNHNVVISRLDSLESLPLRAYNSIRKNTDFFVLDDAAENPGDLAEETEDFMDSENIEDLSGLHAKLIITENGRRATVFTGSANVTKPAFLGKNVEFMVALSGQRKHIGIKRFLGDENSRISFMNMLVPYTGHSEPPVENETQKMLERMLEDTRRTLLDARILAKIEREPEEGTFHLRVSTAVGAVSLPDEVSGNCYPITIAESRSKDVGELLDQGDVWFDELTAEALTGFLAFRLTARKSGERAGLSFVMNLPVEGMPDDRDKHILYHILSDQETFIRYLLLILGSEDQLLMSHATGKGKGGISGGRGYLLPLFEEMVRAFSREPEKIDRISDIIEDLKKAGNLQKVLPSGFEKIWQAFRDESLGDY